MSKKTVALLLALVLVFGAAVGGTLAWLTAQTDAVVNTFTVGDINIALTEHKLDGEQLSETETTNTNTYNFVPGDILPKDPWVTVEKDSEACYVFLKVTIEKNSVAAVADKHGALDKIIDFTIDSTVWTPVEAGKTDYYYTTIDSKVTADQTLNILKDKQVTVSPDLTKAMAETLGANAPKLSFKAAAVQMDNVKADNGKTAVEVAFDLIKADLDG